jgi:hypothetical protein
MTVPFMMGMMGNDGDILAGFELRRGPGAKRQVKDTDNYFALAQNIPINPHHHHHFETRRVYHAGFFRRSRGKLNS